LTSDSPEIDGDENKKGDRGEIPGLDGFDESKVSEEFVSEDEEEGDRQRQPFRYPPDMLSKWFDNVNAPVLDREEPGHSIEYATVSDDLGQYAEGPTPVPKEQVPFQLPVYKKFIQHSEAYQWLLSKIRQYGQLTFEEHNTMFDIGARIQNQLRAQEPLRTISRRKPPSLVRMTFNLDWNPIRFLHDQGFTPPLAGVLDSVLCLTGSQGEAYVATITEYVEQTWPITAEPIISLLRELISHPEGQECTCKF